MLLQPMTRFYIELNAHPRRLDMDWRHWHQAKDKGVMTSINPDAHEMEGLLYVNAGVNIAPTSDFVRETAFNLIGPVDDATVLDLFAGSGALGLEALSRGAERAVFVDSDREACRTINANLEKLRLRGDRALPGRRPRGRRRARHLRPDPLRPALRLRPPARARAAPRPDSRARRPARLPDRRSRTEPEIEGLTVRTSRKYGSARLTLFDT